MTTRRSELPPPEPTTERIPRLLETAGLRVTPQRYAVVEHLMTATDHPSADEILEAINRRFPRASRATVYNTVQALEKAGALRSLYLEDGVARYDLNAGRHHHFVCQRCGRIEDLAWETFATLPVGRTLEGSSVQGFEVTVRGLCRRCR